MALYWKVNSCPNFHPSLLILLKIARQQFRYYSENKTATIEMDSIDDFTSQLLRKKLDKWEIKKTNAKLFVNHIQAQQNLDNISCNFDFPFLNTEQLDEKFHIAIENDSREEVIELIKQCLKYRKCPSRLILTSILSICAQRGDKNLVIQIKDLCAECQPQILENNSNFQHFVAEAIWVKGDVFKAIEIFENIYRDNAYLRRRIRLMLKYLIVDLVANRSEASLLNIIGFSERLVKEFKDFYPLMCIWQACFLSDWYSDQQIAMKLLENNNGLCKMVGNQIPYVVFVSLKGHNIEVVYRLLEILLKYNMKSTVSNVLMSLLDYYFHWGNKRGCMEVIHWAITNDIDLPTNLHVKLIILLVLKSEGKCSRTMKITNDNKTNKYKYELKF